MAARVRWCRLLLLSVAALSLATACSAFRTSPAQPREPSAPDSRPPSVGIASRDARLRDLLERALAGGGDIESLQLRVDCRAESQLRSLQVFGNGVGILDDRVQFRLSRPAIDGLLRALARSGFPNLRDTYGEVEADAVTMMICRVEVALGGVAKDVVQLAQGEQSAVLARLASHLLAACEPVARDGVRAAGLRDGLLKIASGELAPESWSVTLQRRAEKEGQPPGSGYLLAITTRSASSHELGASTGGGERHELALPIEEIRALAAELAARDLPGWPANLWATDYVDLAVRVLQHETSVQARRFAGLDAGRHPGAQRELGEVLEMLERLHRRVVEEGASASQLR